MAAAPQDASHFGPSTKVVHPPVCLGARHHLRISVHGMRSIVLSTKVVVGLYHFGGVGRTRRGSDSRPAMEITMGPLTSRV